MKRFKDTRIGAIILRNFPLKILALVTAVILWIVVVNIDNPVSPRRFSNLPVTLVNDQILIDKGYTYEIVSGSTVSVTVKAPQTVIDSLKPEDFAATADVENLTDNKTIKIQVAYVGTEFDKNQIDLTYSSYMQLVIENEVSKEFAIHVDKDAMGSPEAGYIISDASVSPTTIKVTGAKSVVDEIDHVAVNYDVTNMNQSVTDTVKPVFYNADGKALDVSRLSCSRDSVRIDIVILPTKWVDVNYALSGTPADGYEVDSDTPNVTSVQIAGTRENLAKIDSIDIPAGGLDVTGLRENTTLSVSLPTYLSRDYFLISDTKTLSVDVAIKHMITRDIEISYDQISIKGLSNNLQATLTNGAKLPNADDEQENEDEDEPRAGSTTNSIVVTVYGEESAVNALTVAELSPTVSATARVPGTYTVKISMVTNERYTIEDTYYITLIITEIAEEPTTKEDKPSAENPTTAPTAPTQPVTTTHSNKEEETTAEASEEVTGSSTTTSTRSGNSN